MTRRLRILMANDTLDVGGSQRVVVSLSQGLAARGHELAVLAEPGGELWDELPAEVRRIAAPPRRTAVERLRYFWMLARLVRGGGFDVVHAHQRAIALQARIARAGTPVRVVEHVHSLFRADDRVRALLSFRGDRLVACGRGPAEMLVQEFGRPAERITTVPNAVRDLSAGASLRLPVTTGRTPTILVLGRVTDIKDPRRFIDVIECLNTGRPRVEARWVGDGDMLAECRAEVLRRRVPGLTFVGARSDVVPELQHADMVMLTSRQEGLPLSLLEAASMGRALAAPDLGSCGDVVRNGRTGVLFEPGSTPAQIAEQLGAVLEAPTLQAMGEASRQVYLDGYAIENWLDSMEEVYRDAVVGGAAERD